MDIYDEIIHKIKKNKISTTEIADCLGKTGVLKGVLPINRGQFHVGRVFLAYDYDESNWDLHDQVRYVQEDQIVVVELHNCKERAIFGELVSKYILLYRGAAAIVVNGNMRDAPRLIRNNYPVWCKSVTPVGCFNKEHMSPIDPIIVAQWKRVYDGAIAVCDDCGVVIIPKEQVTKEFSEKLDFIELQEDIWFYCTDTKKWSTYDTVCLKKYLDTELLPEELREKFVKFVKHD